MTAPYEREVLTFSATAAPCGVPADLLEILSCAVSDTDHDCTPEQVVAAMRYGALRFGSYDAPWFDCGDA